MLLQQILSVESVEAVLAEKIFMLVFTVSMHQAIEILDQTVMAVALVRKEEEIDVPVCLHFRYSKWINPICRIVAENIHRYFILCLKFRYVLQRHWKRDSIEV